MPEHTPPRDEETRSEHVFFRVSSAEKALIEMEAERRGTTASLLIETIAYERVHPTGRTVPSPKICGWLRDVAAELERDAQSSAVLPRLLGHASDLRRMLRKVTHRSRKQDRLMSREIGRAEKIGFRVKPRVKNWLEYQSDLRDTSLSSLLRTATLEGIAERSHLARTKGLLQRWVEDVSSLTDTSDASSVQADMLTLADKMREHARSLEEGVT